MFRGLMSAQAAATIICAVVAGLLGGTQVALAALWGGAICMLAFAWAGFQLWLHPGNRRQHRMAGAAIRAEMGKIAIMLLLLWLTFREWPEVRERGTAAALLLTFFITQTAGWVWLARAGWAPEERALSRDHDG